MTILAATNTLETGSIRSTLEAETTKAGWISFFIAGRVRAPAIGFSREKTLGVALTHVTKCIWIAELE
jgi:hypothetical protein